MAYLLRFYILLLSLFTLYMTCDSILKIDPMVNTDLGLIRGLAASDGDYTMFKGIPYAKVNMSNPFGAAIPQVPFENVFDAYDDTSICPQYEQFNNTLVGSLDCLHLNIFVPNVANTMNKVPVLVWLYGGGFSVGFAGTYTYGPKFLVRHNIILITINYRLGPYGFMCLDIPEIPGNSGLKDQLIALRWIKKNIEAFGGDSNKITVFGESAGAASIDFHLLSSQEKLFDKMILQSATSLVSLFFEPNKEALFQLASHLGLDTNNYEEAISYLASINSNDIISTSSSLGLNFRICMEQQFEGVEGIILENWIRAPIPKAKSMPILLGFNSNEYLWMYLSQPESYFDNLITFNGRLSYGFDTNHPDFVGMEEIVRKFYLGDKEISIDSIYEMNDFDSDFTYAHPTYRSINKYIANSAANIYQYVFSYNGGRNFMKRTLNYTADGAFHADEIGYLFDVSFYEREPTDEDQLIIDRMTTLWTNFAKFSNPTPETSDLLPVEWKPITKDSSHYYLNIDSEISLGTRPLSNRMAFWDLFYRVNDNLQTLYPREQ